jgi:hypothetical protein
VGPADIAGRGGAPGHPIRSRHDLGEWIDRCEPWDRDEPRTYVVDVAGTLLLGAAASATAALTAVGGGTLARDVAGELRDNPHYWTRGCRWTTAGDALVCDGAHAYRKLGSSLTPAELSLITHAFRGRSAMT